MVKVSSEMLVIVNKVVPKQFKLFNLDNVLNHRNNPKYDVYLTYWLRGLKCTFHIHVRTSVSSMCIVSVNELNWACARNAKR